MILSVSRRTDIPNYYSKWFIQRLEEGFVYVRNPINAHQISRISLSPEVIDAIVFWTKNPLPMMEHLDALKDYNYYFQFTLNGYGTDLEPGIPDKKSRMIPAFRQLSEIIGKDRLVWRYDPILLNSRYTLDWHIRTFREFAEALCGYTDTAVISFVDMYQKIRSAVGQYAVRRPNEDEMRCLAKALSAAGKDCGMGLETCAEEIDLSDYGIGHGHCIDKARIEKIAGYQIRGKKDKNQRKSCGCIGSVEIGTYHTCRNGCRYCYACDKKRQSGILPLYDEAAPMLCGVVNDGDIIKEKPMESQRRKRRRFD